MRMIAGAMIGALMASGGALAAEPACQTLTPALVGGPVPAAASDTAVLRWLGTANYEVAYKGKVYLFDTYYDRPGRTRPIGFKVDQVKRADVIFIGHAHSDHISDIAAVAKQTGALVVGSKISIDTAVRLGVPQAQTKVVADGDELHFGPVKVLAALARHSTIQDGLIAAHRQMYQVDELAPLTPEQQAHAKEIGSKGSSDPHLIDQGTIGYAMVLPSGFSIVIFDTAGPITDGDRALAKKLGRADVLTVPYAPHPVAEHQVRDSWPFVETFDPKIVLPTHHDAIWGAWLDNGLQPLREKLRDERPNVQFVDPLVRSAICVQTAGKGRGTLAVKY
ncbi:MAG TPA: MBL fold metallo-hydrolase [Caulobacteraceae bacterium]|jgi:L-ascorbate metabolism protein UlaG (beta-lactamase superfamily)